MKLFISQVFLSACLIFAISNCTGQEVDKQEKHSKQPAGKFLTQTCRNAECRVMCSTPLLINSDCVEFVLGDVSIQLPNCYCQSDSPVITTTALINSLSINVSKKQREDILNFKEKLLNYVKPESVANKLSGEFGNVIKSIEEDGESYYSSLSEFLVSWNKYQDGLLNQ